MRLVEIGKAKEESPLATLADDIERNEVGWKEWAGLEAPEAALMPADLTAKLSLFEQLLVSHEATSYCHQSVASVSIHLKDGQDTLLAGRQGQSQQRFGHENHHEYYANI